MAYNIPQLKTVSEEIPLTTTTAERLLGIHDLGIIQYVVCPKCHSIYDYKDCIVLASNGQRHSKLCCFVKFPNHPHPSKRHPCDTALMKMVNNELVPILTYPYFPLHLSLSNLASTPNFLELCERWRHREVTIPSGLLADIYDGSVWESFRNSFFYLPLIPYC